MTALVHGGDQFTAKMAAYRQSIEAGLVAAQREVVRFTTWQWQQEKTTWSKYQPNDIWTGQYRASIDISVGRPSGFSEPIHPEVASGQVHWPDQPASPYRPQDIGNMLARMNGLAPFQTVYVSDAAPGARDVENHVYPRRMAYETSKAWFRSFNWRDVVTDTSAPF